MPSTTCRRPVARVESSYASDRIPSFNGLRRTAMIAIALVRKRDSELENNTDTERTFAVRSLLVDGLRLLFLPLRVDISPHPSRWVSFLGLLLWSP